MAQDLHDGVGHGLAVIAMQAGVALHVLDRDPTKARGASRRSATRSRESLDVLRAELARLSRRTGDAAPRPPRRARRPRRAARPGPRRRAGGRRSTVEPGELPEPRSSGGVRRGAGVADQRAAARARASRRRRASSDAATTGRHRARRRARPRRPAAGQRWRHGDLAGCATRVEALGGTLDAGPATERRFRVRAVDPAEA